MSARGSDVFAFLADPLNQCWIADSVLEVVERGQPAAGAGAVVRLRGPLGTTRTGELRLLGSRPPESLLMLLDGLGGARVFVLWDIVPSGNASVVRVRVAVQGPGTSDRLLLSMGGSRWLLARMEAVLRELDFVAGATRHKGVRCAARSIPR